jgi:hypothetical protein
VAGAAIDEVAQRRQPVAVARVDDDLVAVAEQSLPGGTAEAVGGAGDERRVPLRNVGGQWSPVSRLSASASVAVGVAAQLASSPSVSADADPGSAV